MRRALHSLSCAMRAIVVNEFGGPEVLKLVTEAPVPKPGPGQVLIQVKASGVNPVDTYTRQGLRGPGVTCPYIPGKDGAGVVAALGENVSRAKEGQRVGFVFATTGTCAEYAVVPENTLFPLSDKLNFSEGASIGVPYFTAYRGMVHKANLRAGQTVLVHGASGAVGLACCQIGHQLGMNVIGTAGTPEGMELAKANGACHVFNHREEGYTEKIMEVTGGEGVHAVMEMLADVNLDMDTTLLRKYGSIVVIGSRGTIEINPRNLMVKETSIQGLMLYEVTPDQFAESAAFFYSGQELGWLRPVVDKEYPLEATSEAHKEVMAHNAGGALGKIVVVMDGGHTKPVPL